MDFRVASTFTDSLARLTTQEQKAAKVSAMDLQMNQISTGLQLHRIDKSKDKNFWSVRVNSDLRIIVHKTTESTLLAYVDHHDKAYQWAERRRIEAHPKTGAIQIVEVRERVTEIAPEFPLEPVNAPPVQQADEPRVSCFGGLTRDQLLSVGVPSDWLDDVLVADDDRFLALADYLPSEASEALLEYIATGSLIVPKPVAPKEAYEHPDTLRRIRVVESAEELERALEYPWERWLVYLHPSQQEIIEKNFSGPARVAGSAGTGKTVVALHRAVRLARNDSQSRVLLTTFSGPLARMLSRKLELFIGQDRGLASRITVTPFHGVAQQLYELSFGRKPHIATDEAIRNLLTKAGREHDASDVPVRFLWSEWSNVIDAWQLADEQAYGSVSRLGRKNRLSAKQRAKLWPIFQDAREALGKIGTSTWASVLSELVKRYTEPGRTKPFTHIVVDEAQDLGVPELRLLAAIAGNGPNNLFFAGDLGQRIFQQPFSWLGLGVDVRGRSQVLKVNYRTSHQIRTTADRLLPSTLRDVDGIEDRRAGTVSVFNGPEPSVRHFDTEAAEADAVGAWIGKALADGLAPAEIGVFVRDHEQLDRARRAVRAAGQAEFVLTEDAVDANTKIAVGTMHLAKGLEFKAVAVVACDDEVLPLQSRVEAIADEVELDDVFETERQLLYVACTRARDRLLVTCVSPGSEFLRDISPQA